MTAFRPHRPARSLLAGVAFVTLASVIVACGGDDEESASTTEAASTTDAASATTEAAPTTDAGSATTEAAPTTEVDDPSTTAGDDGEGRILSVPDDHPTIQAAVDAAAPGDLILIEPGVYHEAVDVTTEDITIRGVDRNEVILDGEFELENGIRVLDADGVVVENMTARNYTTNGFFWTGSDRYRGSFLTAFRNGDYGVYAFDSYTGQFDNSLGSGSPDAGFYIGQCYKCDAVIDNVIAEHNGLGYSGTNSGGDLYIVNSTFRNNRAGIVPNSGSYELCYPGRDTTIIGNIIHDNNNVDAPAISVALMAHGNGILLAGAIDSTVERNLVFNHERAGIAAVPFPEEDANDVPPPADQHQVPCDEASAAELPDPDSIPDLVLWHPTGNTIRDNVISDSGLADIASSTIALDATMSTAQLGNCFSGNVHTTSAPTDLEALAPCEGEGSGGDWEAGAFDLPALINDQPVAPPADSWKTTPEPEPQPSMPDARTAPVERFTGPELPDLDAIKVPARP